MTEEVKNRALRKQRKGIVVSKSGDKSIVLVVESRKPHPLYGKIIKQSSKFHAHDEENAANVGDTVVVMETRPISKMKRWRLVEVTEKAKV